MDRMFWWLVGGVKLENLGKIFESVILLRLAKKRVFRFLTEIVFIYIARKFYVYIDKH